MSGGPPKPVPSVLGLPPVPFKKLYTFATPADKARVVLACVCAAASGAILPLFSLVFGSSLNALNDSTDAIVERINDLSLKFLLIAIGASVLTFLENYLIVSSTEIQMKRLREAYCKNLLRLDFAWYDTHRTGEAVTRLAEASVSVVTGMEKVASITRYSATLVCGLTIGFTTSWKLTLVIMACAPLFAIALAVLIVTAISAEKGERLAYARAGDAASEVFSLMRAVAAFGGERHEAGRYAKFLARAEAAGIKKGVGIGWAVGCMLFTFYSMYGISTYSGAQFIAESREAKPECTFNPTLDGCYTGGTVVSTFVAVLLGALSFGQIGPLFGQLSAARAAAADLYGVIDVVPSVDSSDPSGATEPKAEHQSAGGLAIEFCNVSFAYPSRKNVPILTDFSLAIKPGEVVGVVGASGSGKSTLCALAMRAYDVDAGTVLVGGINVKEWNLPALRAALGYVSQDPVLFSCSVRDNIAMGKPGVPLEKVSEEDIVTAATASNAHSFVSTLPLGYNTLAATSISSSQLSGGQRQRICIARALIRSPRVMLLDEATSALDTASERLVQGALDKLAEGGGRTMLIVAHRLSTLRNAHRIVVVQQGTIIEQGSPTELNKIEGGTYRSMLAAQQVADPGSDAASPTDAKEPFVEVAQIKPTLDVTESLPASTQKVAVVTTDTRSLRSRLMALQLEDKNILILGILGSLMSGSIQPIVSIVYGGMITVFYIPDSDEMRRESLKYLGYFFALAGGALIGVLCRVSVFTYLGERMTRKLRQQCFEAVARQQGAFFDKAENSVGRITTRLATDAALVKGASGEALGSIIEGFSAIAAAIVISFTASWRLALVLLVCFPLLIVGGIFEFKSVAQVNKGGNKELENAADLLSEAVVAARTVAAYGLQPRTYNIFSKALEGPLANGMRRGKVTGIGGGFQRFVLMATYSVAFYAGAQFISRGWLDFGHLIKTFLAITLAAESVGRVSASAPDTAKAESAAEAIFALIDAGKATKADPFNSEAGYRPSVINDSLKLDIVFENVSFSYPSRPDTLVLKNFSATIYAGQFVGVVGASGSGKSTLVLLLGRVYDANSGRILVGGVDVQEWNVAVLRECLGLVQQEPALFADSINYNIAYGTSSNAKAEPEQGALPLETGDSGVAKGADKEREKEGEAKKDIEMVEKGDVEEGGAASSTKSKAASMASVQPVVKEYPSASPEVIEAAKFANAAEFIDKMVDGYATYCGSRGNQLSGGQKQRVAIARALLRRPRVLLLDEATAALDSKSEETVQAALDNVIAMELNKAEKSRTTLCIAHRLSTLANADRIIVLDNGSIVEDGSHVSLMGKPNGKYRSLAMQQKAGLST